jgi:hypothetical protein
MKRTPRKTRKTYTKTGERDVKIINILRGSDNRALYVEFRENDRKGFDASLPIDELKSSYRRVRV